MVKRNDIKVLYTTYPLAFNVLGGAEIQLLKTKEYLEKIGGCRIKLFDMFNDRIDQYDILHNFMMLPDCLAIAKMAKRVGTKLCLSPVYWRTRSSFNISMIENLYTNLKHYRTLTFRQLYPFKDFLEAADIILPNSKMEAELLAKDFHINSQKFFVVPNGVDKKFYSATPDLFIDKHGMFDFVLYVGRIMRRKNPLSIINVCKELDLPLVMIGHPNPGEEKYFEECQRKALSAKNIKMLGFLSYDSEELRSAYAAAKVFVLPSNFETPGLSALEAGLAGCNVVITSEGSTREYFKECAWYVNPSSLKDLKVKIKDAYEAPKSSRLKKFILENYTWEKVAQKTLEAYKLVLNKAE